MRRVFPSPAIIVAILALVAGVTGAAVASPVANKAVSKKKVKKIADKEITKKAPGLSVAHAATADHATSADTATTAETAGYARVNSDGTTSVAKGVTGTTLSGTSLYCFDLSFTPKVAVAASESAVDHLTLPSVPGPVGCPAAFRDAAVNVHTTGGVAAPGPFYVIFE